MTRWQRGRIFEEYFPPAYVPIRPGKVHIMRYDPTSIP